MWVSLSGVLDGPWLAFDLAEIHNQKADRTDQFCPEFIRPNASTGWYQSSCYTQLGALSDSAGIVCYEKQGVCSCAL